MTEQQKAAMLAMLKVDIGVTTEAYDGRLEQYIQSAAAEITREGVTLDCDSVNDCQLVVMYAAWTWRKRDNTTKYAGEANAGMPRMLRYALNNRLFSEKVAANG